MACTACGAQLALDVDVCPTCGGVAMLVETEPTQVAELPADAPDVPEAALGAAPSPDTFDRVKAMTGPLPPPTPQRRRRSGPKAKPDAGPRFDDAARVATPVRPTDVVGTEALQDAPKEDSPRPARKDALIGEKLGEYIVEERIGIGGMGIVYRAVQPMIGNSVAIKVLRPDVIADERDMERLLQEARTVNAIRHRSIISIFGAGQTPDGRQYLVMEFLEGQSLEQLLAREGALPCASALPILEDVLSALAAAHAAKVVHRDLKPANVFLVAQTDGLPWVKLLDFGLARKSTKLDVSRVAGTPDYIAPEHAVGAAPGPAADLYAFGVLAFRMLLGRLPFIGTTAIEVMEMHVRDTPPVPLELDPSLPVAMSELITRLLDKDPARRPAADAVRAELKLVSKQLRLASTQVGFREGAASAADGPAVEASTSEQLPPVAALDPRLERMAMALDEGAGPPRPRFALARHWPWAVGIFALLWVAGVVGYRVGVGTEAPAKTRVSVYGDQDPVERPVAPSPPSSSAPEHPLPVDAPAPAAPLKRDWRIEATERVAGLKTSLETTRNPELKTALKRVEQLLGVAKAKREGSAADRARFEQAINALEARLERSER